MRGTKSKLSDTSSLRAHGAGEGRRDRSIAWAAAAAFSVVLWLLRGGLAPAPPGTAWPWEAGAVLTGWTQEPYLLLVLGPDWLLTLSWFTLVRISVLGALLGLGTLSWLRARRLLASCAPKPSSRSGLAAFAAPFVALLGGAGGCCLPLAPVALLLGGGLASLLPYLDGVAAGLLIAAIGGADGRLAGEGWKGFRSWAAMAARWAGLLFLLLTMAWGLTEAVPGLATGSAGLGQAWRSGGSFAAGLTLVGLAGAGWSALRGMSLPSPRAR